PCCGSTCGAAGSVPRNRIALGAPRLRRRRSHPTLSRLPTSDAHWRLWSARHFKLLHLLPLIACHYDCYTRRDEPKRDGVSPQREPICCCSRYSRLQVPSATT